MFRNRAVNDFNDNNFYTDAKATLVQFFCGQITIENVLMLSDIVIVFV